MSDVRIKVFAEYTAEGVTEAVNSLLEQPNIKYIDHQFMVDGVSRAYNIALAYIETTKEGDK